jgi:hypothetical protein
VKGIQFVGKHCSWTASVGVRRNKRIRIFLYGVLKQVTRGFIFVFIYIELSQIYKSIFKLNINYSNSHIVQDELTRERKFRVNHTTCMETPRCSLDAASPVVENLQKYRYILENIDGIFIDFSWFVPNFAIHINNIDWEIFWLFICFEDLYISLRISRHSLTSSCQILPFFG